MTSDKEIVVKKEIYQKPMELYSSGANGAFEENRHRENQDYFDDGGHNLFRFSDNGLPNKNMGLNKSHLLSSIQIIKHRYHKNR